jgi:hypothetical protein
MRIARALGACGLATALAAGAAHAGFQVEVTTGAGFQVAQVSNVVVVSTECHEALDCRRIEREVAAELVRAKPGTKVFVGDAVYSELLRMGRESYGVDLRAARRTRCHPLCGRFESVA